MPEASDAHSDSRESVLDEVARRSRVTVAARARRLRVAALPIAQIAIAAASAWWIAQNVFGHDLPFFAPIAAVISLGISFGQRLRRAVELVLGVALGILVGDLLVSWIGTGTWQIAVVVALALASAVFLGGGPLVINQAGASAVLVVVLTPPQPGEFLTYTRFVDALVGGLVGLVMSIVLLPVNPLTVARRHVEPVLDELALTLQDIGEALARGDRRAASAALSARAVQTKVDEMHAGLAGSDEVARLAPARWRVRTALSAYLAAAEPLDLAVRNTRVVARNSVAVLRAGEGVPPGFPAAVTGAAEAVRRLRRELADGAEPVATRRLLLSSARAATDGLDEDSGLFGQGLVVSVRSLAVDLLIATGLEREVVREAMPAAPSP